MMDWVISSITETVGESTLNVIVPSKLTQLTLDSLCERVRIYAHNKGMKVKINLIPTKDELDEFASYSRRPMSHTVN